MGVHDKVALALNGNHARGYCRYLARIYGTGYTVVMLNRNNTRTALETAALAVVLMLALSTRPANYWDMNCAQYVCHTRHVPAATASQIYSGAASFRTVAEYQSFAAIDKAALHDGDVLAFNGTHVAVVVGNVIMDSDPKHGGPGLLQYVAGDSWFKGPVRIMVTK